MTILWVLCVAFAYFYGSINNAVMLAGMMKKDIRQMGSGNPGAMNMFRSLGIGPGIATLVLDAVKGAIPSLLGWFCLGDKFVFGEDRIGLYVCAAAVLIGHLFPIYYKFKGGKGVASTIGVCFVLNPALTGISLSIAAVVLLITKYGFLASFTALTLPCIYESVVQIIAGNYLEGVVIFFIFAVVVLMHRKNIARFINGNENKTILFGKDKTKDKIAKELQEKQDKENTQN